MFPLGDETRGSRRVPWVTGGLIVVNVLVYVYQMTLELPQLADFSFTYGAIPAEIVQGNDVYTLVTSLFVHTGLMHLFGNMLFL